MNLADKRGFLKWKSIHLFFPLNQFSSFSL